MVTETSVLKIRGHYYNYLLGRKLETLEKIIAYGRKKLLSAKNFGRKGLAELEPELRKHGYGFDSYCNSCGVTVRFGVQYCSHCEASAEHVWLMFWPG